MGDTLETTITIKQDLFKDPYKITIIGETIQVLENVFYTKVSRVRQLTVTPPLASQGIFLPCFPRKLPSLLLREASHCIFMYFGIGVNLAIGGV